jgi:cytochrome c biogenesis protein CcmG/thiol:disulfide interchange protein DsbE
MRSRWTLATLAACALAWTTLTAEMPWLVAPEASVAPPEAAACAADAKTANLDFTLKDVGNKNVSLGDYRGKVILLDFWATWCVPCKVEIPWFIEFQQKHGPRGFQVIGISVDDTLDRLSPYVKSMNMTYPVLQGLGHDNVQDAYGPLPGLPVTVLISRDGKICAKHIGLVNKDEMEKQIKALL